jgi:hypothetical protein
MSKSDSNQFKESQRQSWDSNLKDGRNGGRLSTNDILFNTRSLTVPAYLLCSVNVDPGLVDPLRVPND